ncbi:MAG: glycosyltransferase [Candidatus Nomurabacteria bacterium]|nr:glycosyltransferase [Candidatus Nomurabacteria bacterium]
MGLKTSIITSMYNKHSEVLKIIDELFIPSLIQNGNKDTEIIIIDDCSLLEAETENLINKHLPSLRNSFASVIFVKNQVNLGFAKSFNRGINMACGENLLITNDDVYFPIGSIKKLVDTLSESENYALVGPVSNNIELWSFQYCKQAPKIASYSDQEIARLELFSTWLAKNMHNQRKTVDNLCGFCFAADASFLKKFGGFSEKYKHGYFEDTDLIKQITKKYGYEKIAVNMEVFINHGGPKGASQTFKQLPVKMFISLIVNSFKYANTWGYSTLLKRIIYGLKSHFGIGTISELIPKKIKF